MSNMSGMEELTVVELRQLLKDKELAISGKKSELIERLMSNEDEEKSKNDDATNTQLPFLKSLYQNGISSVKFDRRQTIRYGAAVFMLFFVILGLNSNSWYFMEFTATDGDPDMGLYVEEKTRLNFGLGDIEIIYSADGIVWGGPVSSETSEYVEFDGEECKSTDEFSCNDFSSAGGLNKIALLITVLSLLIIIGFGITKGLGKELAPVLENNETRICEFSWGIATVLPIISTLCYRVLIGFSEMNLVGWDKDGFGLMWWSMMVVSLSFFGLIHNQQISSLVAKFKKNG